MAAHTSPPREKNQQRHTYSLQEKTKQPTVRCPPPQRLSQRVLVHHSVSRALLVDHLCPVLFVLCLRQPHLVKAAQRTQDGAAEPGADPEATTKAQHQEPTAHKTPSNKEGDKSAINTSCHPRQRKKSGPRTETRA